MSEPSSRHRGELARVFLPAYNERHSTAFCNPPDPEVPGSYWDLRWPAPTRGGSPLEVQLVHGPLDPTSDWIHPRTVSRLHAAIQDWSDHRELMGHAISVGLPRRTSRPPPLDVLESFVREKLEEALCRPLQIGERRTVHRAQLHSGDHLPEIRLYRHEGAFRTLVYSPSVVSHIPLSRPRLRQAIDKKHSSLHGRRSELILLVEFDVDGYDEEGIQGLRQEVASGPVLFREVWGISLWSPGERADRLWP